MLTPVVQRDRRGTLDTPLIEAATAADVARFWRHVDRGEPSVCWPWRGAPNEHGYGRLNLGGRAGRHVLAHRFSYFVEYLDAPGEKRVCHKCDNPICVNPAHLFLGTQADNIADASAKGRIATGERHGMRTRPDRRPTGERHGMHRLTVEDVRAIRAADVSARGTMAALARTYGVSPTTIRDIVVRRKWGHVA